MQRRQFVYRKLHHYADLFVQLDSGSNVVHRVQVTTSATYKTLVPWKVIPTSFSLSNTVTIRGN